MATVLSGAFALSGVVAARAGSDLLSDGTDVLIDANHLLEFTELRKLRNELRSVSRIERILVLELRYKELKKRLFACELVYTRESRSA